MSRSALSVLVGCVVMLVVLSGPSTASGEEIPWLTDVGPALKQAESSGKPVLVDVWAVWCVPCKEMDETTYRDPAVVEAMTGFVPLKVDHDISEIFVERHEVDALPAVLVLDGEGKEVMRLSGLVETPRMLEAMRTTVAGYDAYLDRRSDLADLPSVESTASYLLSLGNGGGAADHLRRAIKASKKSTAAHREQLELWLAAAQCIADGPRVAATAFEKLSRRAEDPEVRGQALEGLARAQLGRGRRGEAERSMELLRRDYPELAAGLASVEGEPCSATLR